MGKMVTVVVVGFVATLATEPGEDAFRKLFRFYLQSAGDHLGEVVNFFAARGTGPDVSLDLFLSQTPSCQGTSGTG
uniref:Uncharacterized protein n=1 Tax=Castor canadensis TaxID=51338 RepID=A0A8C0WIN9_CASCN